MEEGTQDVMMRAHKRGVELVKEYAPLIERVSSQLLETERIIRSAGANHGDAIREGDSR